VVLSRAVESPSLGMLPTAHRYGQEHAATVGVFAGMAVMAATLVMLR